MFWPTLSVGAIAISRPQARRCAILPWDRASPRFGVGERTGRDVRRARGDSSLSILRIAGICRWARRFPSRRCRPAAWPHRDVGGDRPDHRNPAQITRTMSDILRARVFAIACGYQDADDLDDLRKDAAMAPLASITASAPRPALRAWTCAMRSAVDWSSRIRIVPGAPSWRASANRSGKRSITTTQSAPARLATTAAARPNYPLPWITTISDRRMPPRRSVACKIVGMGQPKAMTGRDGVSSGIRKNAMPTGRSGTSRPDPTCAPVSLHCPGPGREQYLN